MKAIVYEFKKTIGKRQTIIFLILMCCFNMFYFAYHLTQNVQIYRLDQKSALQAFHDLHEEFDGSLTTAKVTKLNAMYEALNTSIMNGTYDVTFSDETLSGYEYTDYQIIKFYFYDPIKRLALYENNTNSLIANVEQNLDELEKNTALYSYNRYILKHFQNRSIAQFYNYTGWEYILDYQMSDLIILLILIVGILPTFIKEKKTAMSEMLNTTRVGRANLFRTKIMVACMFVCFLVLGFSLMNMAMTHYFLGISGFSSPIYALEGFGNTPYTCSIVAFYMLCQLFKSIGFMILSCIFLLIAKFVKEYLSAFVIAITLCITFLYIGGYSTTFSPVLRALSLISPFQLVNFVSVTKVVEGFNIHNIYVNKDFMIILTQVMIFIILLACILCRRIGGQFVKLGIKKDSF